MTTATGAMSHTQGARSALRAAAFAGIVWGALTYAGASPDWIAPAAGLAVAAVSLASAEVAVAVAIAFLTLPVMAVNPVVGIAVAVLGLASLGYLGAGGGRAFLIIASTVAGVLLGPAWAGVVLAGLLLGPGEGALAAVLTGIAVQAFGLITGKPAIGVLLTGGPVDPLVRFPIPKPLTSPELFGHLLRQVDAAAMSEVTKTVSSAENIAALVAQPVLWGGVALCAGLIADVSKRRANPFIGMGGAGVCVGALALGTVSLRAAFGAPLAVDRVALAAVTSFGLALVGAAMAGMLSPRSTGGLRRIESPSKQDEAEVDELLRVIANAEETLAERHTVEAVVLMSDMQSFSEMTEEDGSLQSAKTIQRHRDLLLPVVERWGGRGKSSGGDGLVAAFDEPRSALAAAAEMQRVLADFNRKRTGERAMNVRIGIASGEVVVDRLGRPFIGVGLNLAARVMSLAEGEQSLATAEVALASGGAVATKPVGTFRLKNISAPVDVVELLRSEAA